MVKSQKPPESGLTLHNYPRLIIAVDATVHPELYSAPPYLFRYSFSQLFSICYHFVVNADKFISFLGRGTFGDVMLMLNTDDLYRYAVKRIPRLPSDVRKANNIKWKFDLERLKSIKDEPLQIPYEYFSDKVYNYIVYDYQVEGTLRTFLQSPTLPKDITPEQVRSTKHYSYSFFR